MKSHRTISQAIWQAINRAKDVLIFSHQKPDGDTLGANLALTRFLKNLNKNVTSFCIDPLPLGLQFLPDSHCLTQDHLVFTKKYDLIIALDSGSLDYAGVRYLLTALPINYTLINIDHHASNDHYGHINLVIHDASSTCEVIYRLLKDWQVTLDKEMATHLSTGIITDTGGFRNNATGHLSLSAAADLYRQGANLQQIMNQTLNNRELKHLKLWGRTLERLQHVDQYQLVYTFVTQQDFLECEISDGNIEGIANFLHILNEGKIILVLKEDADNMIKGSMRTTTDIDLAKIATLLGGGGHKKASGFSLPGKLVYDNNKLRVI
ncbi:MAG: bifunctional oligoribonuclease/PAP phosphatase NrnA [Patescibacteria group bacterium]